MNLDERLRLLREDFGNEVTAAILGLTTEEVIQHSLDPSDLPELPGGATSVARQVLTTDKTDNYTFDGSGESYVLSDDDTTFSPSLTDGVWDVTLNLWFQLPDGPGNLATGIFYELFDADDVSLGNESELVSSYFGGSAASSPGGAGFNAIAPRAILVVPPDHRAELRGWTAWGPDNAGDDCILRYSLAPSFICVRLADTVTS